MLTFYREPSPLPSSRASRALRWSSSPATVDVEEPVQSLHGGGGRVGLGRRVRVAVRSNLVSGGVWGHLKLWRPGGKAEFWREPQFAVSGGVRRAPRGCAPWP